MICYRVVRHQYAGLTGEGARLYGGRFNPPGIPAVYTSQSIALAVLEILVHVDKSEVPNDYVVMAIRFAGRRVSRRLDNHLAGIKHFTIDRFRSSFYRCPVLRVASVIVPREYTLYCYRKGMDSTLRSNGSSRSALIAVYSRSSRRKVKERAIER